MTSRNKDPNFMPPLPQAFALGLQHVLAMLASNITVPIIVISAIGLNADDRVFMIQAAILAAGLATLLQTVGPGPIGARLPVVQGTSFAFIPVLIPIGKGFGMAAVFGASLFSGIVQMLVSTFVGKLRSMIPSLVSGIVVATIGLSLLPIGIKYSAGGVGATDFGAWYHLTLAMIVIVFAILLRLLFRGFIGAAGIFFAICAGYVVAVPMGLIDMTRVNASGWFSLPTPLSFGLELPVSVIIPMIVLAFITTIETIGDISGIAMGGADREATDRELRGGILADGLGTALAALINALPNTSFSQNVGLVSFTGVMSRHVVSLGALVLIAAGLMPKFGALVTTIPNAVLGGAMVVTFGMVVAAGIKLMTQAHMGRRNMLIVALSLGLGLGLANVPEAVQILPETLRLMLVSGIVPAGVIAFVLNLVLPDDDDDDIVPQVDG